MLIASNEMKSYFDEIKSLTEKAFKIASKAREKGYDPEKHVEVSTAANMAERVMKLIAIVAPQIEESGEEIISRISSLEKQYGTLDWRVCLKIAEEVAFQKFCSFGSEKEAIEVGIRTGFAYLTLGTVSSPLDGFINIEFKERLDKRGKYMCINYAGPIRNAGGTPSSVSVLIADYLRMLKGFDTYDPSEEEVKRAVTELRDYHERITNLQYFPSEEEIKFMVQNLPVEISGDPSEHIEVSNFKDLKRVPTNQLRSGYSLVIAECLCQKATKIFNQLSKWGKDFNFGHWGFLNEFLAIQKKAKAKGGGMQKDKLVLSPDYTFINDIVAGRPVFSHPLRKGGLRVRYGRARTSGYSSDALHPATMYVSNQYLATGTQLKLERPKKGSAITPCDTIEGPIVKLEDGSVVQLDTVKNAKEVFSKIIEIIFLGDILINYGDFYNRAHSLVPAGYCPEWWSKEFEKAIVDSLGSFDLEKLSSLVDIPSKTLELMINNPLKIFPDADTSIKISKIMNIPLHPSYTYFWNMLNKEGLLSLIAWLGKADIKLNSENSVEKIVLTNSEKPKRCLELIGMPHAVVNKEYVVIEKNHAKALHASFGMDVRKPEETREIIEKNESQDVLELINTVSSLRIRDKAGTFIGARMGRPEKAKLRKLTGSPQVLFPVGEEGGKLRSFQSAMNIGKVTAEFPMFFCQACNKKTIYQKCEVCEKEAKKSFYCKLCGDIEESICRKHGNALDYSTQEIDVNHYFSHALKKLGMKTYPDLIKGVRGTSNKSHIPENLAKGVLRCKYDLYINKDGTIRYDMTQLPITHFKPVEIGTNLQKLKELGYTKDIYEKELTSETQILELKPQDVILPSCYESPDESADKTLFRISRFIDELLVNLYGLPPFYNLSTEKDIIGHLIIGLAPHTSAGIIGRVIGFTQTQGFFAHPMLHAATRRDCDGDEACFILLMDALLNFSRKYLPESRGSTMDAPLVLTSTLIPSEVDDMLLDLDTVSSYPLELYEAALKYKMPGEVSVRQIKSALNTPEQYEKLRFTHDTENLNDAVRCSAYKTLPSMEDKLKGQMDLAEKILAVDKEDVARLVVERHFIRDTKGNLRKFSTQEFRCSNCNTKFRRPPLVGKCTKCSGKLIFTVSEGNIIKYLELSINLAKKYKLGAYLQQSIEILQRRIESIFGKEKDRQVVLADWLK